MTRYFFDVTDLRTYLEYNQTVSGIQRVVVMAAAQARHQLGADNVWLSYHDSKTDTYRACRIEAGSHLGITRIDDLRLALQVRRHPRTIPALGSLARRPLRRLWRIWMLDFAALSGWRSKLRKYHLTADDWIAQRNQIRRRITTPRSVETTELVKVSKPGDRLLLLGNVLFLKDAEPHFKTFARAHGLQIEALLHDLIPIVMPYVVVKNNSEKLRDWIVRSKGYVSKYIANSETTGRDLRDFLASNKIEAEVKVVPLAQSGLPIGTSSSYSQESSTSQEMPEENIRRLAKTEFVLVVGTREVRKNLWRLAQAWDRLKRNAQLNVPKLVVVGRLGWMNDDFETLITTTAGLGGWIEVIENASDADLTWLYQRCLFTVTASLYEGWGLPIGESLSYGKTAVVSETSSMPEVGADLVEYCDPTDIGSIEMACRRLISDTDRRKELEARIKTTKLRSWEDVSNDLLAAGAVDAMPSGTSSG